MSIEVLCASVTAHAEEPKERIELRRFRPYARYKDSGVPWLGEVPTHWGVSKLAWLIDCLDRHRVPLNAEQRSRMQGQYPYWGANAIVDYLDNWLFDEELVLLGEDGAPFFDRTRSVAFHVSGKIWVNNHAHVLSCARGAVDAGFLTHALNSVDYRAFIDGTTRDKLTQGDMKRIPVQCPDISEQRAIAAFLDSEAAKIDELIAKKERMIELLDEKRIAVISRAVSKGIDPKVAMKDSRVTWIGEIPAHWELKRLKYIVRQALRYGANEPAELKDPDLPRYIRITDIRGDGTLRDDSFRSIPEKVAEPYLLSDGDILFARSGATVGKTFRYEPSWGRAAHAGYLIRARLEKCLASPTFVLYFTQSKNYKDWLFSSFIQATIQNVSAERYASLRVPLPPRPEQDEIVRQVDANVGELAHLASTILAAIERLKELRTALVFNAVRGKIDVREEVRSLGWL
jgi:type I restriction enzyme S subunit